MRKKYGVLLFVLLTANSVWPEERPPLRQRFVRYMHLHKASKFIKRQYRDKHKRRAWLSIGGVGIAIFLLKRIELLRTFWRSKGCLPSFISFLLQVVELRGRNDQEVHL